MAETLDASWWRGYREFRQDEIMVRASSVTLLGRRPSTKDIDQLFEDLAKIAVPPAVSAGPARIEKRPEGGPGRCGRLAGETIRRGEPSKRRQADAFQGTSGIHRAARHGDVLPGLSGEMARHRKGPGAAAGRVGARRGGDRVVVEKTIRRDSGRAGAGPASMKRPFGFMRPRDRRRCRPL
jgi:hypothetical protein